MSKYVPNKAFVVDKIPEFNPISQHYERLSWWKEQKRRCIEGYWVDGKWCPGVLYFYVNFWNIEVESKESLGKTIGRPWFRDLEWDKGRIMVEARGFSGFADDEKYTCNETVRDLEKIKEKGLLNQYIKNNYVREEDLEKEYVTAREYLTWIHPRNMGKALFQNEAKNVIDLESRGGGKSFFAGGNIAHNFLFDGAIDYDIYLAKKKTAKPLTSQTLVGAIDSAFSKDLLSKFTLGMKYLPGEVEFNGEKYPSPLSVNYHGSLQPGKYLASEISRSKLHHRTFKDNPLAANGTRPSLAYIEETGFMDNIEEVLGAMKECVASGERQFGTIYMFGTGGLFKGMAAQFMQNIFYRPKDYNCLAFPDEWEGRKEIGYFVPAYKTLNGFKETDDYITNDELALNYLKEERESLKKNKIKYASEVINRPIVPSEVFFSMEGTFFPLTELKQAKANLLKDDKLQDAAWRGWCVPDEKGEIIWKNTTDTPITDWPYKATEMGQGCIEIYEMPAKAADGKVTSGVYIAGCDPVDDDGYEGSLQSAFILNRLTGRIVAEYTGRHERADQYYENLRKLLIFYNAKCNYENAKKGLYQYFHNMTSTHLLVETPKLLRDANMVRTAATGNKSYGTPANQSINRWARDLIKKWLLEPAYNSDTRMNVDTIRSIAAIEELIRWNEDGNFDRVSALGMLMILREEKFKVKARIEKQKRDNSTRWGEYMKKINKYHNSAIGDQSFNLKNPIKS